MKKQTRIHFKGGSLLLILSVLGLAGKSAAGLDPELDKPYRVQVVVHFGDHRLLTKTFKEETERDIRDGLQAALGDMGKVESSQDHPLLKTIESKGLQAMDAWKNLDPIKTCFVLIDYSDGEYHIQARRHDGYTGQVSPLRGAISTTDRPVIARKATLLLQQDFGLLGTVMEQKPDAKKVRVAFKAGSLEGDRPLDAWIKKGDLFAVVSVSGTSSQPSVVRWTYLQVEESLEKGSWWCQILQQEGQTKSLVSEVPGQGHRCIKLGTTKGPLRLRLVRTGAKVLTPEPGIQVQVRRHGFQDDNGVERGSTDKNGYWPIKTDVLYDQVAFVTVLHNNSVRGQVPVPIVDQVPEILPITINTDARTQLKLSKDLWEQHLFEGQLGMAEQFKALRNASPDKRKDILEKAHFALKNLEDDIKGFEGERETLTSDAKKLPGSATFLNLTVGDQRLADLKNARAELAKFITDQEAIAMAENDPKRKEILELLQKARSLEAEADFDKALETHDKAHELAAAAGVDDAKHFEYVKQLKDVWKIKNKEHAATRKFVYDIWPTLKDLNGIKADLDKAREALSTCKRVNDYLTALKLSMATNELVGKLQKEKADLKPDLNLEDGPHAEEIEKLVDDLAKLLAGINDFLELKKPATK